MNNQTNLIEIIESIKNVPLEHNQSIITITAFNHYLTYPNEELYFELDLMIESQGITSHQSIKLRDYGWIEDIDHNGNFIMGYPDIDIIAIPSAIADLLNRFETHITLPEVA